MRTRNMFCLGWSCVVLLVPLIVPGASLFAGPQAVKPTSDPSLCQLNIEGKFIETLTLEKRRADHRFDPTNPMVIARPGPRVDLPAGEYRVQEVCLLGGYRCHPPASIEDGETGEVREVGWFTVDTDTPYVLRIGAPLKPALDVVRENRTLSMAYRLLDASEQEHWRYFPEDCGRETRASVSIYRGDQLVGSGALAPAGYG